MEPWSLTGRVVTGRGEAASYTRLDQARELFRSELGIDPSPGTLDLRLEPHQHATWRRVRESPQGVVRLPAPGPGGCAFRAYPVRLAGRVPGAIVLPELDGYPADQLELIAALPLRRELGLADGDALTLTGLRPLRVRAVVFDVDGTLVDSLAAVIELATRVAPGLEVGEEIVRRALNEQASLWHVLLPPGSAGRAERIERAQAEARRLWPEVVRSRCHAFAGVAATLDALAGQGLRLGIFTGAWTGTFEPLQRLGLLERFDAVLTRSDVERGKPHPEGLIACARRLGAEPADAVYVGDTSADVRAARAAGMGVVSVLTGVGDSAALSAAGPDWLVSSHARLPAVLVARTAASGRSSA